jgi:peptidoglycan/xylan/chitin deacetylase (PgdA/CDA1 family)
MVGILHKLFNRAASRLAIDLGWARRQFDARRGHFRVLTYHGIVPDEVADQPWVPGQAVTVSQFERQMAMLAEVGPACAVGERRRTLAEDAEAPASVCITFDDGLADNAAVALPILRKYGHRATFFLATGCLGRGQYLLNDMIRLLRPLYEAGTFEAPTEICAQVFEEPGFAKTCSTSRYAEDIRALWASHRYDVDQPALECLPMMTWEQARLLVSAGMEIGAHTVHHVILSREKRRTRRDEIVESVARIRARLGQYEVPFSYPNGEAGDYEQYDLDILEAIETPFAVTEQGGWNSIDTPRLELRRSCIGLHCSDHGFLAAMFGLADAEPDDRRQSA